MVFIIFKLGIAEGCYPQSMFETVNVAEDFGDETNLVDTAKGRCLRSCKICKLSLHFQLHIFKTIFCLFELHNRI